MAETDISGFDTGEFNQGISRTENGVGQTSNGVGETV